MDNKSIRRANLQMLIDAAGGQKQLSQQTGIAPSMFSQVKNQSRDMGDSLARRIEKALAKPLGWMDIPHGPSDSVNETHPDYGSDLSGASADPDRFYSIPVYDEHLAAGVGIQHNGDALKGHMPFPIDWLTMNNLPTNGLVIAYASGDSMSPKIEDGDTLMIDTSQKRPLSGNVYAFSVEGDLRVKRFVKSSFGTWIIQSDSDDPAYKDEIVSPQEADSLNIIGQVVKVIGNI